MPDHPPNEGAFTTLNALAQEIYETLADLFPVCLASDEFHFFPHYKNTRSTACGWDDFSREGVAAFFNHASQWQGRLHKLTPSLPDRAISTDIELLSKVLTTLEEQLRLVQPQMTQPTFYLTIVSIGLAESLDHSRDAFERRVDTLPSFLDAAGTNLLKVPVDFADPANEMVSKLCRWLARLPLSDKQRRSIMDALDRFKNHLQGVQKAVDFRIDSDLYARVADFHMGCRMGLDDIARHLDDEIEATTRLLAQSAQRLSAGSPWPDVFHALPAPRAADGDVAGLYQQAITRLKDHCLENRLFLREDIAGPKDVEIQYIPEHLIPVRANAAYTMPPGHPPAGGIFYISPAGRQTVPRDMMLLAAHETFPGHHLLDTLRWQHRRPLRRCLEFPLFYEGWASFGEEILFDTALFSGPADRLLMAKRRFWRAQRGRAELRIHTGRCSLKEAAVELAQTGLASREQALAMVRRYALKPGYQLSYAIGRRNFRRIYRAYIEQGHTPSQFVRDILSEGEIGFQHLEQKMLNDSANKFGVGR